MSAPFDAAVVGSGPNGLAAAITLARAGRSVVVLEASSTPGGGCRTAALTLPGFRHDVCSAVHPLAVVSPFFRSADLTERGVEFVQPPVPLAHVLDGGRAALLQSSVAATAEGLSAAGDDAAWNRLFARAVNNAEPLVDDLLGPARIPRHPLLLAAFGRHAIRSVEGLSRHSFRGVEASALMAGMAAHAMLPLTAAGTAGIAMMLAVAGQSVGWPVVRGGSDAIVKALTGMLTDLGGEVRCDVTVRGFGDIPAARAVLFDTTAEQLVEIAAARLPQGYVSRLRRFPRGAGVFKIDYALRGAIPWTNAGAQRAGTVHIGGSLEEVAAAERSVADGRHPERPFCLVVQPSIVDSSRAPAGQQTAWVYCHVPNGSTVDMTAAIEAQMERFAPGFRDIVVARHVMDTAAVERYNANYRGGDIGGGRQDLAHIYTRPVARISPYTTPNRHIFICSAATPPGGGVHGMCGYYGARAALRGVLR